MMATTLKQKTTSKERRHFSYRTALLIFTVLYQRKIKSTNLVSFNKNQ